MFIKKNQGLLNRSHQRILKKYISLHHHKVMVPVIVSEFSRTAPVLCDYVVVPSPGVIARGDATAAGGITLP